MATGVEKTLNLLAGTANEAAVAVLVAALDSPEPDIQNGALTAILQRRRGAGARELVQRWGRLSEHWKQQIIEHPRQIAPAIRDAIVSCDAKLCANACEALLRIRDFELIPVLVNTIEDPESPCARMLAETLIGMCELLQEEISGDRGKQRVREPARIRQQVLPSLERSVDCYEQHRHPELAEAFLILTNHENPLLKQLLHEPRHPSYLVVTQLLRNSPRIAIIRLVLNLLESRFAPTIALHTVSHRTDILFVRQLLQRLANTSSNSLTASLRRVDSIGWLEEDPGILDALTEQEQGTAVKVALSSNMNRIQAFNAIRYLLCNGRGTGRQAASKALAEFGGAEANRLVLSGLHDPDPYVRANMVMQLRGRGIPGAISRLVELLNSPHEVVAHAAQSCLSEFNFNRYLTVFDMMEDDVRRSTGLLVLRIDSTAIAQLAEELKAPMRTRRLRGLEIARIMNAAQHVEPLIIGLLQDSDHFVRAEAARTLASCNSPLAQQSLRKTLLDRSFMVREAAENSLRALTAEQQTTDSDSMAWIAQTADSSPLKQNVTGSSHP